VVGAWGLRNELVRQYKNWGYEDRKLTDIALLLRIYQEQHGRLPPAALYGKDGTPLLSWRVLLLQYVEQGELYKQFKLDEPWDSPHNKTLLEKMPAVYADPSWGEGELLPYHTVSHVFVGKGAAFEGRQGLRVPHDFPDGPENTLLVVMAGKPVPWTKPEDLAYDPEGPLPDLRSGARSTFPVIMADGSRLSVAKTTSEATLRAAITRNGGDNLGLDWNP
jgi:hypothetical protein